MPSKRTPAFYYGIFFLILTLLLGCGFIAQAADIYHEAVQARAAVRAEVSAQAAAEGLSELETDIKIAVAVHSIPVYSRGIVTARLRQMLPFVCLWLTALIGAIVLQCRYPAHAKPRPAGDIMLRQKLRSLSVPIAPKDGRQDDYDLAIAQYRHLRRKAVILRAVAAGVALAALSAPVIYLFRADHFPGEDLTAEVRAAALYALPFLAVLFADAVAFSYLSEDLQKKSLSALKAARSAGVCPPPSPRKPDFRKSAARIALLLIGLTLVVIGTQNGSMHEVLIKAINICTECIGLG